MNALSDETLMAYADSELDDEEREMVERVLEQDLNARAKVDEFRRSGAALKKYTAILSESDSDELIETIRTHENSSKIVQFPRTSTRSNWMRLAASLVLGVSLGGGGMKIALDQRNDQNQIAELQFRGGKVGPEREVQTANAPTSDMVRLEEVRLEKIRAEIKIARIELMNILDHVSDKTIELDRKEYSIDLDVKLEKLLMEENKAKLKDLSSTSYYSDLLMEAAIFYKQLLTESENILGSEHPNVADVLEKYAALLHKIDRSAEAERLELRAKEIRARHSENK